MLLLLLTRCNSERSIIGGHSVRGVCRLCNVCWLDSHNFNPETRVWWGSVSSFKTINANLLLGKNGFKNLSTNLTQSVSPPITYAILRASICPKTRPKIISWWRTLRILELFLFLALNTVYNIIEEENSKTKPPKHGGLQKRKICQPPL